MLQEIAPHIFTRNLKIRPRGIPIWWLRSTVTPCCWLRGGSTVSVVRNGDRLLLIRYANRPKVVPYALIAGFTEIGETMEQTVRREVMEEVGLHVKNVLYYANQPWGFAGNQTVGFWADLDGDGTVTLDTSELKEAVWLCREEIPQVYDPADLTHTMTELFRLGKDPR